MTSLLAFSPSASHALALGGYCFAEAFLAAFFGAAFLPAVFLLPVFFAEAFFFAALPSGGGGIFAPLSRASDNPIAIACFGFVTLAPLPLFSLPSLNAFISRSTDFDAAGPYFLPLLFLVAMRLHPPGQ
jgi:hypothetical protein